METKEELINKICMVPVCTDLSLYKQHLQLLLNDYEVEKSKKEIAIYEGDINVNLIEKFAICKTVKGCTERTIKLYAYQLNKFSEYINKPFTSVIADDIRIYIAEKAIKDKVSRETQKCIHASLSSFFTWLSREEYIVKNPMERVEPPKKEKKRKKAFTEMEIEVLRKSTVSALEDALLETMLSTWCRVSELSSINVTDIMPDGSIEVLGKGQKVRKVYLNAKAKLAIEKYLEERRQPNIALFTGRNNQRLTAAAIQYICKAWEDGTGIQDCHPHRFRRTGATFALHAGMPIQDVSKLLGHESIATTQIYLDINEKEIERSHEKYVR